MFLINFFILLRTSKQFQLNLIRNIDFVRTAVYSNEFCRESEGGALHVHTNHGNQKEELKGKPPGEAGDNFSSVSDVNKVIGI